MVPDFPLPNDANRPNTDQSTRCRWKPTYGRLPWRSWSVVGATMTTSDENIIDRFKGCDVLNVLLLGQKSVRHQGRALSLLIIRPMPKSIHFFVWRTSSIDWKYCWTRLTYNCAHLRSTKESLTDSVKKKIFRKFVWVKICWVNIFLVNIFFGVKFFGWTFFEWKLWVKFLWVIFFWVTIFLSENFWVKIC